VILGAVLAGGRSTRFGSDKALAMLGGVSLLEICDDVLVVGREGGIPDWPAPEMGPLGGLAAALRHGRDKGFAYVLSAPVDAVGLEGVLQALTPAPAYVASQPVIGLWPVSAAEVIETILLGTGRHSLIAFARGCGARAVALPCPPANINYPADLAALMEPKYGL